MERLLKKEMPDPDHIEKSPNWAINRTRIIAADILRFDRANKIALEIAKRWVSVMEQACGAVDFDTYLSCYLNEFDIPLIKNADKTKNQCGNDICNYYPAVIYAGLFTKEQKMRGLLIYCSIKAECIFPYRFRSEKRRTDSATARC
jgi:hypothetical protein